ncbi:MAG: UDP-N-acetylmuramoyl-tripeptide--D-alanyl-D-alanine ligase [Lacunisphaera sp.]|nr:UDP-N-acetylmuramoyl-tripeptide--D-alanyl-D-alanine ligase [Lacunisphaera sp.]
MAAWTGGRWTRIPGGTVGGFTQDTRQLAAGQVFVALKTDKRDGHDFIAEAQQRGATAALVSREDRAVTLPQLVVGDTIEAFQRIAREHRREFHGTVVGVSGSVGKTSTKDLLALLLGGAPRVLATEGNLNNHLGVPLTLTRLDPAVHQAAVIEAGISAPGDMAPLARMIEPEHSVITLVAPAHLEKLGSLEVVALEKSLLPAANRPGGQAVFPVSGWAFESFRALRNPLVLVPENEGMTKVSARTIRFNVFHRPERTEVTLDRTRRFLLRRVSGGMAQNAALALALAGDLGVADAVLQTRLADWAPSKWRGELRAFGEATVYCDFYNANPASMADAIDAFNGSVPQALPRLYVLGCMEELGEASLLYHRQLGRLLHLRRGDFLFVLGAQAGALREGLLENGNDPAAVAVIPDLAPVRERLAGWQGAVFLKGSRRYQLETVLNPHAPAHAL